MHKGYRILFFFLIVLLLQTFPYEKVDAARELCTSDVLSEMRAKAYKTTFSYELKFDSENVAYFEISYANLSEGIEIRYGENVYSYDEKNPTGTIKTSFPNTGETYDIGLYAEYGYPCVGELLYTKKVTLPKYNKYSELEDCIEYEEFPLCNKWYSGEIENEDYFYSKLEEYVRSLIPEEEEEEEKKEESFIQKLVRLYIENLMITLPLTLLLVAVIVIIIIRRMIRKKNRVKIGI